MLLAAPGVSAELRLAADINPGEGHSLPYGFTAFNGKVYFGANDEAGGTEPWVTDGSGAMQLEDVNAGAESSDPNEFTVVGDRLYFTAGHGYGGVWVTDGSGAEPVPAVENGALFLRELGGKLYYVSDTKPDGSYGGTLWVTDGATSSLVIGSVGQFPLRNDTLTTFNGRLYFVYDAGYCSSYYDFCGNQLWATDGTTTERISAFTPNTYRTLATFHVHSNKLYFIVENDTGVSLWATDGYDTGKVVDLPPERNFYDMYSSSRLYLQGYDDFDRGEELWMLDRDEVVLVKDTHASEPDGEVSINVLGHYKGELYFGVQEFDADFATITAELHAADGASLRSVMSDLDGVTSGAVFDDRLYFGTYVDGGSGAFGVSGKLWFTDGVSVTKAADLLAFPMLVDNDKLYLAAHDAARGLELWVLTVGSGSGSGDGGAGGGGGSLSLAAFLVALAAIPRALRRQAKESAHFLPHSAPPAQSSLRGYRGKGSGKMRPANGTAFVIGAALAVVIMSAFLLH